MTTLTKFNRRSFVGKLIAILAVRQITGHPATDNWINPIVVHFDGEESPTFEDLALREKRKELDSLYGAAERRLAGKRTTMIAFRADPPPQHGILWFDTTENTFKEWAGTAWVKPT